MKTIFIIILLLPYLSFPAYADSIEEKAAEAAGVQMIEEGLSEEDLEISGEFRFDGTYDVKAALRRLWNKALITAAEGLRAELGYGLYLTVIAVFISIAGTIAQDGKIPPYINLIGCSAAALLIAGSIDGIISEAASVLTDLSDYSKAAIPVIFSAAAAGGAVMSASAKYAAVCLAIDVLMTVSHKFIVPMIYAYLGICISRSLFDNPMLSAAARITKWCATTLMTGMTVAFSAYISMTGLIAGSTDAVAIKTAKTVISSTLPVVGGIISDASAVVLSAASIIKNSAGVFALIAVCAICVGPFIKLSVKMLVFRAAAAAADMLPGGRLSALINDVGTSFSMLLGLVGCGGIMLFVSIMAGIKVVTA